MKTTIDIPESVLPDLAAISAAQGLSVEAYVVKATQEKLKADHPESCGAPSGDGLATDGSKRIVDFHAWWQSIPKADPEAVADVQAVIDEEFSKVDPEEWK